MLRAAGIGASLLVLVALVITLVKSLIAFVGFLTFALQAVIVLGFLALFAFVGLSLFRSFKEKRKHQD